MMTLLKQMMTPMMTPLNMMMGLALTNMSGLQLLNSHFDMLQLHATATGQEKEAILLQDQVRLFVTVCFEPGYFLIHSSLWTMTF